MARSLDVCVVGAGMSGLVAVKELLEEGHRVRCFERAPKEGGNFNYPVGAAYDSMFLTISQYHMAFSSFPPPLDQDRHFWSRQEYARYLHDFGVRFGLFPHIEFDTEVLRIKPEADGARIHVTVRHQGTDEPDELTFDAVAICSGAHAVHIPQVPTFEGADTFTGTIEHAVHYLSPEPYRGKHVVCIGFGETAADITHQIAQVAASCWTSFRRFPAVVKRYYGPYTSDAYNTRIQTMLPRHVINQMRLDSARRMCESPSQVVDPVDRLIAEWTLRCGTPSHQPLQKNDDFVSSILSGKLQVKACGIERLDGDSVVFADGSRVRADVVMCCTGYDEGRPPGYLIDGPDVTRVRDLFKHVFHPDLGERVAFIGWARPVQGGIPACSEMQSRYFALICSGKRSLPEGDELRRLIAEDREAEERAFFARKAQETLVSFTTYMDSVAELVGCRPRVLDYVGNPRMVYRLLCGANIPVAYRLRGPHAMPEMAERVLMSLPVAHSLGELVQLSYMHLLNQLGAFKEPAEPPALEPSPA